MRSAMPSPFPGMNPYLERSNTWADFHDAYLVELRNALIRQVRPNYIVKIEEYVYLHDVGDDAENRERVGRPDVGVIANRDTNIKSSSALLEGPTAVETPPNIELDRVSYLEVRDRDNRTLITAIELLSPSKKSNREDRIQHQFKWRRLLASSANLVEIDLLRVGNECPGSICQHAFTASPSAAGQNDHELPSGPSPSEIGCPSFRFHCAPVKQNPHSTCKLCFTRCTTTPVTLTTSIAPCPNQTSQHQTTPGRQISHGLQLPVKIESRM
jgi:hypothetical protein